MLALDRIVGFVPPIERTDKIVDPLFPVGRLANQPLDMHEVNKAPVVGRPHELRTRPVVVQHVLPVQTRRATSVVSLCGIVQSLQQVLPVNSPSQEGGHDGVVHRRALLVPDIFLPVGVHQRVPVHRLVRY